MNGKNKHPWTGVCGMVVVCGCLLGCSTNSSSSGGLMSSDPEGDSFGRDVRLLLERRCLPCHDSVKLPGMVDLSDRENAIASGALDPAHPAASRILEVVRLGDVDPGAMPPTGHSLNPNDLAVLEAWAADGAPWPAGERLKAPRGAEPRSR